MPSVYITYLHTDTKSHHLHKWNHKFIHSTQPKRFRAESWKCLYEWWIPLHSSYVALESLYTWNLLFQAPKSVFSCSKQQQGSNSWQNKEMKQRQKVEKQFWKSQQRKESFKRLRCLLTSIIVLPRPLCLTAHERAGCRSTHSACVAVASR